MLSLVLLECAFGALFLVYKVLVKSLPVLRGGDGLGVLGIL